MASTEKPSRIVLRGIALEKARQIQTELSLSSLSDAIAVMADRYSKKWSGQIPTPPTAPTTPESPDMPGPMTF